MSGSKQQSSFRWRKRQERKPTEYVLLDEHLRVVKTMQEEIDQLKGLADPWAAKLLQDR